MFKNKRVLVTGSEGLIGKELVEQLTKLKADVYCFDKKLGLMNDITDQQDIEESFEIAKPDYVFHLFGIKGNPKRTKEKPVDFMGPMLQGDTNVILLCEKYNVKRMLYTSSIAVENPESDFYPAWAKSTAEKLIEAMRIQYPNGTKYCIVRPANVYGRFDDFESENAMVVTSLINKALKNNELILDKKGSMQERDFINAKDVARGMIQAMREMPTKPVNLCSGQAVTIKQLATLIEKYHPNPQFAGIFYKDLNLTLGPSKKVMKLNWNFKPKISLDKGIKEVIKWQKY